MSRESDESNGPGEQPTLYDSGSPEEAATVNDEVGTIIDEGPEAAPLSEREWTPTGSLARVGNMKRQLEARASHRRNLAHSLERALGQEHADSRVTLPPARRDGGAADHLSSFPSDPPGDEDDSDGT